ncbi:hypothetical protein QCA50_010087 [Cerrena zonata]|uniref:Flavin-containing monooxygenase n=1 Tax=Cerrena zonata TaxID=2478898 RepID=A0AAW0FZ57_9APHY
MDRVLNIISPKRGSGTDGHSKVDPNLQTTGTESVPVEGSGSERVDRDHDTQKEDIPFNLGSFSIDEYRPLKVVIIGAGFSGITAGIRFRQYIPNIQMTIYEKNEDVGGTWWSNRYPGLACDIPSHCYQLTFEAKTDWSAFYAPGPEILSYMRSVVSKYKLHQHLHLQHELVYARWDSPTSQWHIRLKRPSPNSETGFEEIEDKADFLFSGMGGLSRWSWPDIKGLDKYKGVLYHSAQWDVMEGQSWQDTVKDWGEKTVGVIGVGSSGIQIVPALQSRVKHLYNYVRGKTWLSPPFASDKMSELLKGDPGSENYIFTDEDKQRFQDPETYKAFRHDLEDSLNSVHSSTLRGSEMQNAAKKAFKENMIKRLEKKPWIADHLIPEFGVACRRLTPGPGYLEALCSDNVDFVPTHIKRITTDGIELIDGTTHALDILICATGYDTTYQYPFPIIGLNNTHLSTKWSPHPQTYLSVCVDEFPNFFFALGPNSGVGSGSLLALIERQVEFAVEVVGKMGRERLGSVVVKREAVEDYDEYIEHYFPTSVYSERCRSWYKMGKEEGRVVGLWPGSCLHAIRALQHPRWEDFDYTRIDKTRNRLYWLGDGSTWNEKTMTGDRAWYLGDGHVDYPPVPGD